MKLISLILSIRQNQDIKMISKFLNKGYEAEGCQICNVQFNLLKFERIHKCKRCRKYVCYKCGNQKQKILDEQDKWSEEGHRVCINCWNELNKMTDLIDQNKMEWNKQSLFAVEWLERMNEIKEKDYEYEHFLKLFYTHIKNFEDQNEIIEKDVIKGRTDYTVFNYSLKEFFYIIQQTQNKAMTRKNIANVLYALAARYDQIGYVQGMSGIAAYLLCFSDEKGAFSIFCDLIENIYPPKFFVKGNYGVNLIGLLAQIHFLKEYFIIWLTKVKMPLIAHERDHYEGEEIQQINMVVELCASKALLSLFTGFLAFSQVHFIWTEIKIHRSFVVIQKAFIAALYLVRQNLVQRKSFKVLQKLFQNLSLQQFMQAYYQVKIDEEQKSRIKQEYFEGLAKKWSENSDYNIRNLHKYTNFTQEQMKLLQNSFFKKQKNFQMPKQSFIQLVKCFYQILKQELSEDDSILEITPFFVSKIYDSYRHHTKTVLDFREFICCFSACTKSKLKERLCAIINTYEDKNKHINRVSFQKLIKNLCSLSPNSMDEKKEQFLARMDKNFKNQQQISISQLHILLNDAFINELNDHVKIEVPNIIKMTIDKFLVLEK